MAKLSREEARTQVHDAGLRATAPRLAVLRLLSGSERPLSHSEVAETIGADDWDQATLYRNLRKLVEAGLARIASRVDGVDRYELVTDDGPHLHPHFACRECGVVECLPKAKLSKGVRQEWREALAEAELQYVGTCPECRGLDAPGHALA